MQLTKWKTEKHDQTLEPYMTLIWSKVFLIKDNSRTHRLDLVRKSPFSLLSSYAPSRYTIRRKKNDWLGKKRGCDWSRIRLDSTKWKIWRFGRTTRCGLAVGNQRVSKRKRKYIKFGQLMMRPQQVKSSRFIYLHGWWKGITDSVIYCHELSQSRFE